MTPDIAARLKAAAGPGGFSEDPAEIAPHLEEWRGRYHGASSLLLKPASTEAVSAILAVCHETGTAIVPQGGDTGLVGAQIPFHGEPILSLQRMNRVRSLDAADASMVVDAGMILAQVQNAADEAGMLFPLSLGAEGTCLIGGNLSTNAGGVSVLRYGMARDLVLGLEVVLADGRVLDMLRTLRKANTGYDLKQLFIGAEGTLGVITAAALKLFPKPMRRATAFVGVPSPDAALELLTRLKAATSGLLSGFEIVSGEGLEMVLRHVPGTVRPIATRAPWYVLAEAGSSDVFDLTAAFETTLAAAIADGHALDATMASTIAQRNGMWRIREAMSEAEKKEGPAVKHDISVPVSRVPAFIAKASQAARDLIPGARVIAFGHVGDGNIHFNVGAPRDADARAFLARWDEIAEMVHDIAHGLDGAFSAEHGVGAMKRADLARYKSAAEVAVMRDLKRTLDPKNILNPGKVLPD